MILTYKALDGLGPAYLDPRGQPPGLRPDLYSEAQRLALEELIAGGRDAFRAFLRREKVSAFLSEPEIQGILAAAVPPPAAEEAEPSLSVSLDSTSLTYFPEQSDVEPPVLELGWPGFLSGAFRGLTRVEAHFQPSFGETIYSCKEAVRRQIRSAKEVIAVVMDSFTDIDIFSDLWEACRKRMVPVYILLDQTFLSHFMEMCKNVEFYPEKENLMRVRTIAGNTYYTRSGAKIVGKVHEKFMLVDGIRVATGSYSFTWTDGKLNSSNLLLLSGQVVEHFDLEFRILYAQSTPISPRPPNSYRNSDVFDHLAHKTMQCKDYTAGTLLRAELARLSSTPKKSEKELTEDARRTKMGIRPDLLGSSFIGEEEWVSANEAITDPKEMHSMSTQTEPWKEKPRISNAVTQTEVSLATTGTQTSVASRRAGTQTAVLVNAAMTQTHKDETVEECLVQKLQSKEESPASGNSTSTSSSLWSLSSSSSQCSQTNSTGSLPSLRSSDYPSSHRNEYFQKLHKERQYHHSVIRSKLNHMAAILSRRGQFTESFMGCNSLGYNPRHRHESNTSLISLRDIALYAMNK
uniref:Family with sequence similarity 83 member D n=1 Tax=Sphenodon punctatus TaxID=8508 RepID=A0A8D0GY63_SPHPU